MINKLYINDNLNVMNCLPDSCIDHIITDPPYSTSNKKLSYKDTFKSEQDWIDFITSRIKECHRILKDTGTMLIFISQDMMVELHQIIYNVFGKKNFITTFCWKKRASGSNQSKFCTQQHDYILAVAKNIKKCKWNGVPQIEGQDSSSEFNQHGASREKGNDNNKYPLYINKLTEHNIFDKTDVRFNNKTSYPVYIEGVDKLHLQERSAGDVNRGYGISKNTSFPMYINDGVKDSQRLDKVSKTERNPETRPNSTYPMYINDGYKLEIQSKPSNHGQKRKDVEYPMYINDGYTMVAHQQYPCSTMSYHQIYPLNVSTTKISLTAFPGSIEIYPLNGNKIGCWRSIPSTTQKLIDADMLVIKYGRDGKPKIYQKQYQNYKFNKKTCQLEPFVRTNPIGTILMGDKYPTNKRSNMEIKEIFGDSLFTYSKPLDLIKNLIKVISNPGDTILDLFAGSCTTGQAAFELGRNFILVQIDEGGIPELGKFRLNKTIGEENYVVLNIPADEPDK